MMMGWWWWWGGLDPVSPVVGLLTWDGSISSVLVEEVTTHIALHAGQHGLSTETF